MKKHFVTLHPAGTNVDLTKDEGQIPYTLTSIGDIESSIVTCHIDVKVANLDAVPGINVKHFPLIYNYTLTGIIYLMLNARKIDWLNIYFAGRQALIWMMLYRLLNSKGHIYLKLDLDFRGCHLYDLNAKERKVFRKNTEMADIISAESAEVIKRIQKYSKKEILLVEDGISRIQFDPKIDTKRENIFITVGRLGSYQKATDVLLEAFAKSSENHNWRLILIGNVEQEFNSYIKQYFAKYPWLRDRVIFKGPIYDRNLLYNELCKAKVFVLPSRWESFGISSGEALCCGCRLILSDSIPPAKVMIQDGKYGDIVETENIEALSEALVASTVKKYEQNEINEMSNFANVLFSWKRICTKLYSEMIKVENSSKCRS